MANPKLPPALKYFREGFRPLTVATTAGPTIRRMLPWSTCGHTQGLVRIAPAKQYRIQLHVTTNGRGERPPPRYTVERTMRSRNVAQYRTDERGGGSSPPNCSAV